MQLRCKIIRKLIKQNFNKKNINKKIKNKIIFKMIK